jgi:uncharacterized membrane protein
MPRDELRRWLRRNGWLVPGAYVIVALVAGYTLPRIDIHYSGRGSRFIELSAAERLLGAIAAGMIAFTGIVFSVSLIVAQFWNTAYSLRLMGNRPPT